MANPHASKDNASLAGFLHILRLRKALIALMGAPTTVSYSKVLAD